MPPNERLPESLQEPRLRLLRLDVLVACGKSQEAIALGNAWRELGDEAHAAVAYRRVRAVRLPPPPPLLSGRGARGIVTPYGGMTETADQPESDDARSLPASRAEATANCRLSNSQKRRRASAGAASRPFDGGILWISNDGLIGITTPDGTGTLRVPTAAPTPLEAVVVDAENNGQQQLIVSDGRCPAGDEPPRVHRLPVCQIASLFSAGLGPAVSNELYGFRYPRSSCVAWHWPSAPDLTPCRGEGAT